jgi:hypothetical protein
MIKLKELLEKYGADISFCKDTLKQEVKCENDRIILTYSPAGPISDHYFDENHNIIDYTLDLTGLISEDSDVELTCYWYYGCLPKDIYDNFIDAFDEKDYQLYKDTINETWDKEYHWCSPQSISLCINDNILGHIEYIDEFLFNNLDYQECEHG